MKPYAGTLLGREDRFSGSPASGPEAFRTQCLSRFEADPVSPLAARRALVTGAASRIRRATGNAIRDAGAEVYRPVLADATPSCLAAGPRRGEDVVALYRAVQERLGAPDILVSCAGLGVHERLAEGDPAKWARVLEVNVLGALRLIRAFVPDMLAEGGDVVIVSSVAARTAYPWGGPYAASKAALEMLAETLRLEVLPAVRVTTIAPGVVDT